MSYMFSGCSSLEYLDISNFNLSVLKKKGSYDNIFSGINKIKYISIYSIQNNQNIANDFFFRIK